MKSGDAAAFWARTERGHDGHLLWKGRRVEDGYGYGVTTWKGRMQGTHRIAWLITYGAIPVGSVVRHRCDYPTCVEPTHLMLGTQQDNVGDTIARGRRTPRPPKVRTHCKHGHAFTTENTRLTVEGFQRCRECDRLKTAASRARRRAS